MKLRPPVIAALSLGGAIVLDRVLRGLPGTGELLTVPAPARASGTVPLTAGVALAAWALGLFRRQDTTFEPFGQPTGLVVTGPYRITRNPMYLGMLLVLTGIAALSGRSTLFLAPLTFFITMNRGQIPYEEALLTETFGDEYRAFCRRAPRWLLL